MTLDSGSEGAFKPAQQLSGPALVPIADLANHGPGGNLLGQTVELGRQLRIGRTIGVPKGGGRGQISTDRPLMPAQTVSTSPSTENSFGVTEGATRRPDRSDGHGDSTSAGRQEFVSLVPLAATYGVFDADSYVLPITLMSGDSASSLRPGTARHMLWEYGCMSAGFLPLGRTGEDGFTERLLACLRLDCMCDDDSTVSTQSKAAGLAVLAAKGVDSANARMVGAAADVERCATRKALLQLSDGLSYYNDGPAVAEGTASPWPSLSEEADTIAWLSAEGAGTSHTGVVGPWAALQGHINVSFVQADAAPRRRQPGAKWGLACKLSGGASGCLCHCVVGSMRLTPLRMTSLWWQHRPLCSSTQQYSRLRCLQADAASSCSRYAVSRLMDAPKKLSSGSHVSSAAP